MKLFCKAYFVFLVLFFSFFGKAVAQSNASLRCIVQDSQTNEIITYANAILTDRKTNIVIRRTQTDSAGTLIIGNLPDGIFKLEISFAGYQTIIIDSIKITTTQSVLNVGYLKMNHTGNKLLKEVIVTGAGANTPNGIGRKKFSVEQSLISKGGTATDILQNIPSLTIDGSGNVNLRGSSNVNVLIDGKPSLIGGGDIAQILQSIPANAIESIEVITNPSAKYEAEGESGIINIILKKNKKRGFTGSVNATAGTRNNYSAGTRFSFENSKINIYANYDYQHSNIFSNGYQNIQYLNSPGPLIYSNETFPSTTINNVHNIKAGVDYYISPKNLLSFSGGLNSNKLSRNEILNIGQLDAQQTPLEVIKSTNLTNGNGNAWNLNLDFIRTFKKPKEELAFSIGYAHGINNSIQSFTSDINTINNQTEHFDTSILQPVTENHNSYYNIQADYTLPVGTGTFSAGYRSQVRLDNRSQVVYNFDTASASYKEYFPFSAYFHSNNQIHALYINYQNQIQNFDYQIGIRAEGADLEGNVKGYDTSNALLNTPVKVINKKLYPAITLTQKLEANQLLQFSYSRRVTRPTPRNYSPIPDISDPVNYDVGNPNILPQDIHAFEFGYNKNLHKINFTASVYYRITNDFIAHIESVPVNGVITTTSENLPYSHTGGLEIISRINTSKAWNFTVNANLYETKTAAAPKYGISESSGFSWNLNIVNNFSITKNISFQLRGDYHAPNVSAQDRNHANFGADAAAKINLLHNKASLTINGRDIFVTRKWSFLRDGNGVLLDFERRTIAARASISFDYNFGKDIFHAKKIEHSTEKQEN